MALVTPLKHVMVLAVAALLAVSCGADTDEQVGTAAGEGFDTEVEPVNEGVSVAEAAPEGEAEPQSEPRSEAEGEAKAEPGVEAELEPEREAASEPNAEPEEVAAAERDAAAEPEAGYEAEHVAETVATTTTTTTISTTTTTTTVAAASTSTTTTTVAPLTTTTTTTTTVPPTTTTTVAPLTTTTTTTTTVPPTTTTAAVVEDEPSLLEPEGGHPPVAEAGMIPRDHPYWDYPDCAGQAPWGADCYPPSEWETAQDLSGCTSPYPGEGVGGICASELPFETPRQSRDVVEWTSNCESSWHPVSCENMLRRMKWPLDYLGAHPWCVLQQYYDRVAAYDLSWSQGSETAPRGIKDRHAWHLCATVIDPSLPDNPARRLSQSGISLAEQCRVVLPADVELETTTGRRSRAAERFGSDCDAWAAWVENGASRSSTPDCHRLSRLAQEWMEHHHSTPEHYYPMGC